MYNGLSTLLSVFRVSRLCFRFSIFDIPRSSIALYAHVFFVNIWREKSQSYTKRSEFPPSILLLEYCKQSANFSILTVYKTFLFLACCANELFFVAMYLLSFPPSSSPRLRFMFGFPLSYPVLLALLSFPLCFVKQLINIIQMLNAASKLAISDKIMFSSIRPDGEKRR